MNEFVERLGWVLVHSLWQFALVALLAGAIVRALRRCAMSCSLWRWRCRWSLRWRRGDFMPESLAPLVERLCAALSMTCDA